MAIFLTILKVILWILLAVIGLVLFIILLVLFCPICYKVKGEHNEEATEAYIKLNFLAFSGVVSYIKDRGLDYFFKVFIFTIFSKARQDEKDDAEQLETSDAPEQIGTSDAAEQLEISDAPEQIGISEVSDNTDPDVMESEISSSDVTDELEGILPTEEEIKINKKEQKKLEKERKKEERKLKKEQKKIAKQDKKPFIDRIDDFMDKIDDTLDNLDEKYNKAMTKYDHVMQFLDRDFVQRTIKRVFNVIKRLLGTVKPKKSKGYMKLGLKSSADTGMMLGKISVFYPLYGRWLVIESDFYNKVIEGDVEIKGRIYLFRIVFPVIGMVLTRDFWRTFKLSKKI